jgi:uncharacterized coiled-coil protein SlyX
MRVDPRDLQVRIEALEKRLGALERKLASQAKAKKES